MPDGEPTSEALHLLRADCSRLVRMKLAYLLFNLATCLLLMWASREISRLKRDVQAWQDRYSSAICAGRPVCIHDNYTLGAGPVDIAAEDLQDVVIVGNQIFDQSQANRVVRSYMPGPVDGSISQISK